MAMKRPAAGSSKASRGSNAKRSKEDPLVAKCNAIVSIMSTAEGYSQATLEMLAAAAKGCLLVPTEQRHEVQTGVITMIAEVLNSVEARLADNVAILRGKIAEADAEKVRRAVAVEAAVASKAEKSAAEANAEQAKNESEAATAHERECLKAAVAEQKAGNAELSKAEDKKAAAEAIEKDHFTGLKEGTAGDLHKSLKMVVKLGKDLSLEEQLFSSAAVALRKEPATRGPFDGMVVQQVDDQIRGAIEQLALQLTNGEASKAERAAKVQTCDQKVEGAVAHGEACSAQLQAATMALKEAEAARKAAEKALKDFGPEMFEVASKADAADDELSACKDDLATFKELVEGPPPASETAPAEAPGDAAAEASPQEDAA